MSASVRLCTAPAACVTQKAHHMKMSNSPISRGTYIQDMMSLYSIKELSISWIWLAALALAQRDCEKDGETSVYNQSGLVVPFENLCGRDIRAAVDFPDATSEQRRSDCLDRCVRKAPLCYGFDYGPYISPTQSNCWLMNATFAASSAIKQTFIADAAMLSTDLLAQLPNNCGTLGLRGCFERNSQLGTSISSSTTPSTSSDHVSTPNNPTTISSGIRASAKSSDGFPTSAKIGIGAGVGLVALIAILSGILLVLKRVKRKRQATNYPVIAAEIGQEEHGSRYSRDKTETQTHAHMAPSSPAPAPSCPIKTASSVEQVHEIDGQPRHEK